MDQSDREEPRRVFSQLFEGLQLPQAKGLAEFIRSGNTEGIVPCWGAIARRIMREVTENADRKVLWSALLEQGSKRPLLLFIYLNRDRQEILREVFQDVHRLPVLLQKALVCLENAAEHVPAHLDRLAAPARRVWEAGADRRRWGRQIFEQRVNHLLSFGYSTASTSDLRKSYSESIETLGLPQAKNLAEYIRSGDAEGFVPCWGAIAERIMREVTENADREVLWSVLVGQGDWRPMLIFLYWNRRRSSIMAKVLEDAHRLPARIQRALVCLDEVAEHVPATLGRLDPVARQLWEAGAGERKREREDFELRLTHLLAFRYAEPNSFDAIRKMIEARRVGAGTGNTHFAGTS